MWPVADSGYALAAVAIAALVFVIVTILRFIAQNLSIIERISATLDNHLNSIAQILQALLDKLETLEKKLGD